MTEQQSDPRKRYLKITDLTGGASFITDDFKLGDLSDLLRECSPGGGFKVQVMKMTPEDYESLPEFTGF